MPLRIATCDPVKPSKVSAMRVGQPIPLRRYSFNGKNNGFLEKSARMSSPIMYR